MADANADGRRRVVIERVSPEIDAGRFAIKRTVGEPVVVEADVFTDGHDAIACVLRERHEDAAEWRDVPMEPLVNDRWRGEFTVTALGRHRYTVLAWIDRFGSWRNELAKRVQPADIELALQSGALMLQEAATRAPDADAERLSTWMQALRTPGDVPEKQRLALDAELAQVMARHDARCHATAYARELEVIVDPERARFSAWYELFPRSCVREPCEHGTLAQVEAHLPEIAAMGFDVLYLPPVHPVGRTNRKGPNNAPEAGPEDPGSPWAIGAEEGGHKSVHPQLGSPEDLRRLALHARELGIELALDVAFQCSPDHPYVREHPEWFRWRPDGTVQYAENPPKKYQDIFPFDFETEHWEALWAELESVFDFWIAHGVRTFRVDNPHTKPFGLWERIITDIKRRHPDTVFLAEAFTRPKVMYRLAKLGFTQSYTYFTWRNTKEELTRYLTDLTRTEVREYFRPNLWPNTPDILNEYLQFGGRPAFMARLVLAATLGASYGVYGPAFELIENKPREPGSEEYLDSEKYQIRQWDLRRPESLRDFMARINRIRREHAPLHQDANLEFHPIDNDSLICYSKRSADGTHVVLVIVNLDPYHVQSGWVDLPLAALGLDPVRPFQVHDLLSGARYLWNGPRNYVELDPQAVPAHVLYLRRRVRSERDFEYFM